MIELRAGHGCPPLSVFYRERDPQTHASWADTCCARAGSGRRGTTALRVSCSDLMPSGSAGVLGGCSPRERPWSRFSRSGCSGDVLVPRRRYRDIDVASRTPRPMEFAPTFLCRWSSCWDFECEALWGVEFAAWVRHWHKALLGRWMTCEMQELCVSVQARGAKYRAGHYPDRMCPVLVCVDRS